MSYSYHKKKKKKKVRYLLYSHNCIITQLVFVAFQRNMVKTGWVAKRTTHKTNKIYCKPTHHDNTQTKAN